MSTSTEQEGITLKPVNSPEHPDAILELLEPSGYEELKAGEIKFMYDIKNFKLASGSHIFLNVNNDRFFQSSGPAISAKLSAGNYLAVSFLCLPNRVSLKNYGNYVVRSFKVDKAPGDYIDDTIPMIFYNYPSGRIRDENNGMVLLDFYLLNASLSANGYKVKIEVGGGEFTVTEWIPYILEGLKKKEYEVLLTLLDEKDRMVKNPFNPAKGTFVLY